MNGVLYPLRTTGIFDIPIWGSFVTNGASNPVTSTTYGAGTASVVHTSTGLYTVTLTIQAILTVKYADAHLSESTASGATAEIQPLTVNTGGVDAAFTVSTGTGLSGTWTLTDYTGPVVNWCLVVKNSSVGL